MVLIVYLTFVFLFLLYILFLYFIFFFFFSSRRRHTRSLCDWSSDVCSSDLDGARGARSPAPGRLPPARPPRSSCSCTRAGRSPPGSTRRSPALPPCWSR